MSHSGRVSAHPRSYNAKLHRHSCGEQINDDKNYSFVSFEDIMSPSLVQYVEQWYEVKVKHLHESIYPWDDVQLWFPSEMDLRYHQKLTQTIAIIGIVYIEEYSKLDKVILDLFQKFFEMVRKKTKNTFLNTILNMILNNIHADELKTNLMTIEFK